MTFDDEHFELVMPFVAVASVGGPYDDDAYVAGYEMGQLDVTLATVDPRQVRLPQVFRTPNVRQVDLIAMKHGWKAIEVEHSEGDWTTCLLVRESA